MVETQILLIKIVRALVEVGGFCLLGQGIVAVFAGANRERNGVYLLLRTITQPIIRAFRLVTPKIILDRHLPFVVFFVLFWAWILLAFLRVSLCRANGLAC